MGFFKDHAANVGNSTKSQLRSKIESEWQGMVFVYFYDETVSSICVSSVSLELALLSPSCNFKRNTSSIDLSSASSESQSGITICLSLIIMCDRAFANPFS